MPRLSPRHVILISALAAALVYSHSYRNRWAMDDQPIVLSNPTAQSVEAAGSAFFETFWPRSLGALAGQYRPLTMLTYGIDWSLSDGRPSWFHIVNVLWHAIATALFVMVALAWLSPVGALAAGLVFAVHPVHVEAVANIMGRSEMMAAAGLFVTILTARRYRRAMTARARAAWLAATIAALFAAMLSKEHGVVGVALLALDEFLDPEGDFRESLDLYLAATALTLGWFYLWRGIAGTFAVFSQADTLHGLSFWGRLATMFPAQLHVVRLLVWPMDLAVDYSPQLIPRRVEWSVLASLGLVVSSAIVVLAFAVLRRAPVIAFGILAAVFTYAPTANLLFPSGVLLAERALYFGVVAPALVAGWLMMRAGGGRHGRGVVWSLAVVLAVFGTRTVTRVPVWEDSSSVVVTDFSEHSENYRARLRIGSAYRAEGKKAAALAEALAAAATFPEDPFVAMFTVPRARSLGYMKLALAEARRAYDVLPEHAGVARLVVQSYLGLGLPDSAVPVAQATIETLPDDLLAADIYYTVLDSLEAEPWRRQLARARILWLNGEPGAASRAIDSATVAIPGGIQDQSGCWDLQQAHSLIGRLRPQSTELVELELERAGSLCRP